MSQLKNVQLKLILAGDAAVGKTSIVHRVMGKGFSDTPPTMGVECYSKSFKNESNIVDLRIWDLAGQELFRDQVSGYMGSTDLVVIVFDVTKKETYDSVKSWYEKIYNVVDKDKREVLPCMIIGNKIDLRDKRVVTFDEGIDLTESLNTLYVETSAKENIGIDKAFRNLIVEFIRVSEFF